MKRIPSILFFICCSFHCLTAAYINNGGFEVNLNGWETELINGAEANFTIITAILPIQADKLVDVINRGRPVNSVKLIYKALYFKRTYLYGQVLGKSCSKRIG